MTFSPRDPRRFLSALARFDAENSKDPNTVLDHGQTRPRELAYSEWLTEWVLKLDPHASEELRLAARCQHICRWKTPRESYPMTKSGYLQWREGLKRFHAKTSAAILQEAGYEDEIIARVQQLNLKRDLATDPETQLLEDALCLVFLERQFEELATRLTEEQLVNAVRKSWGKMSSKGRQAAAQLTFSPALAALVRKAIT